MFFNAENEEIFMVEMFRPTAIKPQHVHERECIDLSPSLSISTFEYFPTSKSFFKMRLRYYDESSKHLP
jgi:hypothetical protein